MKFSLHKIFLIAGIMLTLVFLSTACSSKSNDVISTGSIQNDSSQDQAMPDAAESPTASEQPGGYDNSAVSDSTNPSDNAATETPGNNSSTENPADNSEVVTPGANDPGAVISSDSSSSVSDDSGSGSDTSNQGTESSNNNKDNDADNSGNKASDTHSTPDDSNISSSGSDKASGNISDSNDNNTTTDSNNTTQDKQTTDSGQTSDPSDTADATSSGSSTDSNVTAESNGHVIVIDAGHQSKGNYDEEPIGPGSDITKPKVSSGTQGAFTGVPEYKLNLAVAKKVEKELTARGYKVIMIRETNDVNISNKKRADIANKSGADLFIRIHADGSTNSSVNGTSTLYPSKDNPFVPELNKDSYSLAKSIVDAICDSTGGKNRGAIARDDMSGINWCTIPVTIVEMGYMTNEKEDRLMETDEYQAKIVQGICNGIDDYFD